MFIQKLSSSIFLNFMMNFSQSVSPSLGAEAQPVVAAPFSAETRSSQLLTAPEVSGVRGMRVT